MGATTTSRSQAELQLVVALGDRFASAGDEATLACTCAGALRSFLGARGAAYLTESEHATEGAAFDAGELERLRAAATEALHLQSGAVVLEPSPLGGTRDGTLVAGPLRVQREMVGTVVVCVDAASDRVLSLAAAIAQQASAYLGSLRLLQNIRQQAKEMEDLLLDRTRRLQRAETQLIISDRLAAIGTLASGVGHEIANSLSSVLLNHTVLRRKLERAELAAGLLSDAQRLIGENEEALDRIRSILGELRHFGRRGDEETMALDLRDVLRSTLRLGRAHLRGIDVRVVAPEPAYVNGSMARLGQVFLNLVVNAAQALGGRPDPRIDIRCDTSKDGENVVTVRDNGPGIPDEHLPRIFDLYYTTKPAGEGTGLGLAIVHDIIEQHRGRIQVSSSDAGCTFQITLPAARRPSTGASPHVTPAVRPARRRRSENTLEPLRPRLLIVDDDESLLKALARDLEEQFEVTCACSGEAARAAASATQFDVFLLDINLGDENGFDVAGQLGQYSSVSEERFLYMSGASLTDEVRRFVTDNPERFLAKPFDPGELSRLLRRAATA